MTAEPAHISSRQHPFVRRCRELAAGRGEAGDVLLDGPHLVEDALNAQLPLVGVLGDERADALMKRSALAGAPVFRGPTELVASASPVRSTSGIVGIGRWTPADAVDLVAQPNPWLLALMDLQDPGNVGGIIRTADALGATGVLALDRTAHPGNWKALRGAMGSTFRLPVGRGSAQAVMRAAAEHGVRVAAAVPHGGTSLDRIELAPPIIVLVGNEGSGLPQPLIDAADVAVTIPMRSGSSSLNVGVSAALMLWAARHRSGRT